MQVEACVQRRIFKILLAYIFTALPWMFFEMFTAVLRVVGSVGGNAYT